MGVILAATDALNWYAGLVGTPPEALTGGLGALQAPGKTRFLPYLGGERTPLNDAGIRGAFLGLEHATTRETATRAVLEGVTFALRDCRDALAATGTRIKRLTAVGGGLPLGLLARGHRHGLWRARGSCRLPAISGPRSARRGWDRWRSSGRGADLATPPEMARSIEPVAALSDAFDEAHARYVAARTRITGLD